MVHIPLQFYRECYKVSKKREVGKGQVLEWMAVLRQTETNEYFVLDGLIL